MKMFSNLLLLIISILILSSCGFVGDGRMAAWKEAQMSKNTLTAKLIDYRMQKSDEKMKLRYNNGTAQNPTVTVTAYAADGKTKLSTTIVDMAPVISAITGKSSYGDDSNFQEDLALLQNSQSSMPKGEFAEDLTSIVEIAKTPAALVTATGAAIGAGIRESGGGQTSVTAKGDLTLTDSLNKKYGTATNTSSGSVNLNQSEKRINSSYNPTSANCPTGQTLDETTGFCINP